MKNLIVVISVSLLYTFVACSDYLDVKPDDSLAVPDNVQDLQALLDYESVFNMQYPAAGDIGADYYFLSKADWDSRDIDARMTYIWDANAQNHLDWDYSFQRIFHCNVVLDEIEEAKLGSMTESDRDIIKGRAYFYRGWSYFHLAQLYVPYYAKGMADSEYGLPLQLVSDINEPVVRSTVHETYSRIIDDLKHAAELLPDRVGVPTRPSRAAALGALAKLYLIMGDFELSLYYTENSLDINDVLLDYNDVDRDSDIPFEVFNKDVVFHAVMSARSGVHEQGHAFVDTVLVKKYNEDDLRRTAFLKPDDTGLFRFKGSYDGGNYTLFSGIAIDELYLIRSECLARLGREEEALEVLNRLLSKRWQKDRFVPMQLSPNDDLLTIILEEREKQLLFRGGIRWSDLRRLNEDPRYAKTLVRRMDERYELAPGDVRYTFMLPFSVIEISGMPQNQR